MKKAERVPPSSYLIRGGSGRSPSSLARYLIRGDSDEVHHRPQDPPHRRIGGAFDAVRHYVLIQIEPFRTVRHVRRIDAVFTRATSTLGTVEGFNEEFFVER